jgi:hypothetical protein
MLWLVVPGAARGVLRGCLGSCAGLERNTVRQVSGKSHDQAAEALAGVTSATGMEGQNKDD